MQKEVKGQQCPDYVLRVVMGGGFVGARWSLPRPTLLFFPDPVLPLVWSAWLSHTQLQAFSFLISSVSNVAILIVTFILTHICF